MGNEAGKEAGFLFVQSYRVIGNKLKKTHGDSFALDYYQMLIDYALDGVEPDLKPEDRMAKVWENLKPMVDARVEKPKPSNWGSRSLEDLNDDELEELFALYEIKTDYPKLKKKFGMHSRSLSEKKILEAKRIKRGRDLEADSELLEFLVECSEIPKEEWIENVGTMDVSLDALARFAYDDGGALLRRGFFEREFLGKIGGFGDYWKYLAEFVRRCQLSETKK